VLDHHPDTPVVVFAIWEPILATDLIAPGSRLLSRLRDHRVRQFWDPDHLMSAVLKKNDLKPDCCERKGFLWDMAAAYPPGILWGETPRGPVLFDGPVVKRSAEMEAFFGQTK
jgi:hypothetical protein